MRRRCLVHGGVVAVNHSTFQNYLVKVYLLIKIREVFVNNLTGKIVIVEAEDGITYVGKLIEIGEEEVHLESENGWIVIPVYRIANIREKET